MKSTFTPTAASDAEVSYESLVGIDGKMSTYVLRVAFAFLAAASAFALVATLVYVRAANTVGTYVATLSAIINGVAAYHYMEIIKVRTAEAISITSEWKIDALRRALIIYKRRTNPS